MAEHSSGNQADHPTPIHQLASSREQIEDSTLSAAGRAAIRAYLSDKKAGTLLIAEQVHKALSTSSTHSRRQSSTGSRTAITGPRIQECL